ncbi:MAG: glycogen/starch/alpha-glucan phosphorylase [Pseudomonadota bacterium]
MADNMDNNNGSGDLELLHADSVPMTADGLLSDLTHYFYRTLGRRTVRPRQPFLYQALALAVRDRLLERRNQTRTAVQAGRHRRTCYLSLEFLMGRLLRNSLQSLGLEDEAADALNALGLELEEVSEQEHDAGLGNGGLGRLAACFLDSCATLRLPVLGYGIRYQYGMFRQELEHGAQREAPDAWLREGYPWELQRIELSQRIRFGGRTVVHTGSDGTLSYEWVDTAEVLAVPYDIPVPEFSLARVDVDGDHTIEGPAILLCTAGTVDAGVHTLDRGSAAWLPAADGPVELSGRGTVYRAGVNL